MKIPESEPKCPSCIHLNSRYFVDFCKLHTKEVGCVFACEDYSAKETDCGHLCGEWTKNPPTEPGVYWEAERILGTEQFHIEAATFKMVRYGTVEELRKSYAGVDGDFEPDCKCDEWWWSEPVVPPKGPEVVP